MKAKDKRFHIRFEIDEEDGGYTVSILELPGCISSGDSIQEGWEMIKDAMGGWLFVSKKHGDPIPPQFDGVMEELGVFEELKVKAN